jgi:hypothetical protein
MLLFIAAGGGHRIESRRVTLHSADFSTGGIPLKPSPAPWRLYHSASRARIIAGLSGFFTLIQSRDGPDR